MTQLTPVNLAPQLLRNLGQRHRRHSQKRPQAAIEDSGAATSKKPGGEGENENENLKNLALKLRGNRGENEKIHAHVSRLHVSREDSPVTILFSFSFFPPSRNDTLPLKSQILFLLASRWPLSLSLYNILNFNKSAFESYTASNSSRPS